MSSNDLLDAFLSGVDPLVSSSDIHRRDSLVFTPEPENFITTLTKSNLILVIVALLSSVAVIFPAQIEYLLHEFHSHHHILRSNHPQRRLLPISLT